MRAGSGPAGPPHQARSLREELEAIQSPRPQLANALPAGAEKGVRWVAPQLVGEIEFRGWTQDRMLRAASFKGLREDKAPDEVELEPATRTARSAPRPSGAARQAGPAHPSGAHSLAGAGITKQGLAEFYAEIADWILPHVTGRALSLLRCPSGTGAKCFFAKHPWQGLDEACGRVDVGEKEPMMVIDDLAGPAQHGAGRRGRDPSLGLGVAQLEQPDRLIFDLDPGEGVPWSATIAAAREVRRRLADLGLESFLKTSGGKGLHVVVPLEPRRRWEEAKAFTESIAERWRRDQPDTYVATLSKRARGGRIFIDYLRNGRGSTAVAPYSTRSLPQAPVSTYRSTGANCPKSSVRIISRSTTCARDWTT